MRLLLDENLSRRIVPFLQSEYPGSTQVALVGLERASDREIRDYARKNEFVIVTRDADFYEMSVLLGQPPKIIWLKTGNQSKTVALNVLITNRKTIEKALVEDGKACIEIYF
jgi:predicted nuclease of predicted toxin-antitoxin system